MTWWQFAIVAALVPVSVEVSIRLRWREIRGMFDRALMHGGSLDTLTKALRGDSEATRKLADDAITAVRMLKERSEESDARLSARVTALEEHPLLRPLGGPARPHL